MFAKSTFLVIFQLIIILLEKKITHTYGRWFSSHCGLKVKVLPWGGNHQRLSCGTEGNKSRHHGEDEPGYEKPPPVQFSGEVEGYYPHLE